MITFSRRQKSDNTKAVTVNNLTKRPFVDDFDALFSRIFPRGPFFEIIPPFPFIDSP